ncbi:DUF1080 domain-containing protein [Algoriphagus sp. D3-2-R+10]|uniref:3-keto-disaccharide hydrolase n=1 Tax=Algoriphagus aurantiacus TaxID=3103948 RepID=UPI002B377BF6|nr:DUF1080 domain-containing protein [Algoriphagus sp. D3-2-R+10]MEB2774192.1 DUF1080 domain-containing protein [Algoriphagus sp. D3-2-R+10]
MFKANIFLFALSLLASLSCKPEKQWEALFNEKDLTGWDTYLGPEWAATSDSTVKKSDIPTGLNIDPQSVFSVVEVDGRPAIRISGEQWGGLSTMQDYSNYHLSLQFKWGEAKHKPRDKNKRDSGILYHAGGPHGADGGFWMRSQELQVQEGDCGDYWGVAGGIMDIEAKKIDEFYVYDPESEKLTFSDSSPIGRRCVKYPDTENPTGEWNTLELFCYGDTAVHLVNSKVVMVLYNSRYMSETGELPLKSGKIQIQSEGAEIFYRDIKVKKIFELPFDL